MKLKLIHEWLMFIGFGLLAVWLFDSEGAGINLLVFEVPLFCVFFYLRRGTGNTGSPLFIAISIFVLLSLFGILYNNSILAIVVHCCMLLLFAGFHTREKLISPISLTAAVGEKIANLADVNPNSQTSVRKNKRVFLLLPILICIVYMIIYVNAVPAFGQHITEILDTFKKISATSALWLFFGTFVGALILKKVYSPSRVGANEQDLTDYLHRNRTKSTEETLAPKLSYELRGSYILIVSLCILMIPVIATDITSYWFGINSSEAGDLKDIVHEGCYLLIVSVTLSIIITLFVFRKNLNFHPHAQKLKTATLVWLAGNGIMVVSVLIKNLWYINYYGLAYKRIGVLVFLAATVFGIITVIFKIRRQKTAFYLLRLNSMFVLFLFATISCIDWDYNIAAYNLSHTRDKLHKNFLITMNERTLRLLLTEQQLFDEPMQRGDNFEDFVDYHSRMCNCTTYLDVITYRLQQSELKKKNQSWKSSWLNRY